MCNDNSSYLPINLFLVFFYDRRKCLFPLLGILEQQKRRSAVSFDDVSESLENKLKSEKGFDENKAIWKLQLAVQQLPEKQRIVFNLRYFDEMPYEEMGIILDTSVGALKASYHHAVKKIEEYILNH